MLRKGRIFTFWAREMVARREADMEVGEDRHQGRPLGTQGERGERKAKTQHRSKISWDVCLLQSNISAF